MNLHRTIVLTAPGTYDYGGTMHHWQGGGGCSVISDPTPALEIRSDEVIVRNFGVRGAKTGIYIADKPDGSPLQGVKVENVEIKACYQTIRMPTSSVGLEVKDSILVVE